MMSNDLFFIQLQPIDFFFFGGEKKSGINGEANYLVESEPFPQQTSLLGMMRFLLLQYAQNNGLDPESLIGPTGFRENLKEYGIIKKIYPISLYKNETLYRSLPLSYDKELEQREGPLLTKQRNTKLYIHEKSKRRYFTYKDSYRYLNNNYFVNELGEIEPLMFQRDSKQGFFIPYDKIGIQKNNLGATKEKAFFKLKAYKLAKGVSFAFYIKVSNPKPLNDLMEKGEQTVYLGGERSTFVMKISQKEQEEITPLVLAKEQPFTALSKDAFHKIALLSDAYVDLNKIKEKALFVLGEKHSIRYLKSSLSTNNHYKLARSNFKAEESVQQVLLSQAVHLLRRGSVIYCENETAQDEIGTELEAATSFFQVGYNHYFTY